MDHLQSTLGGLPGDLSAEFANNTLNESMLKNQLRSSVIVESTKPSLNGMGSLLQTYAHPISGTMNTSNAMSERPKTSLQVSSTVGH